MPEYQTHKAQVSWGPNIEMMLEDKRAKIEQAIKALIDVLDRTLVESITFSKLENDGKENKESGSTDSSA